MLNAQSENFEFGKPVAAAMAVGLVAVCGAITWSLSAKLDQTVLACILAFVLSQLALIAPKVAIGVTFVFLALMGDIRRLMLYYIGPVQYDVLLLVGPLIAFLLMSVGLFQGKLVATTKIGWWLVLLTMLMILQIFNTKQGGLQVGLGGAFFYIVPFVWFWVGQLHGTEKFLHTFLFRITVPLAVIAALLGLYQAMIGFPDYQYEWLRTQSNVAVFINGRARPFGFFVSPPEYAHYCGIAAAVLLSGLVIKRVRASVLFAPFLVISVFLQGGRTQLLATVASLAGVWGLCPRIGESKISAGRLTLAFVVMFGGLFGSVIWLQDSELDERLQPMVGYQVSGLLKPGESSATGHAALFYTGILSSLIEPAGLGLGATTNAAGKLGGRDNLGNNTEADISNMFVSLGPIGGILYLILLYHVFRTTIVLLRRTRSMEVLAVLGLLICVPVHWLNGGHYAVTAMVWFCVGVVDRLNLNWERENVVAAAPIIRNSVRARTAISSVQFGRVS